MLFPWGVRGGSRERTLLHPAASFLDVCEIPTPLLHWLGMYNGFKRCLDWEELANTVITKASSLCKSMTKNGDIILSASDGPVPRRQLGLSCSWERQRLLVPAEVSALRWRGDAAAVSFQNCSPHGGLGLPLVMSLFERSGNMLMFQTQSGSVAVTPHSIWLGAQNKAPRKARQHKNMDLFPCPLFICAIKEKSLAAFSHKESSKSLLLEKGFEGLLWEAGWTTVGWAFAEALVKEEQGPEVNVLLSQVAGKPLTQKDVLMEETCPDQIWRKDAVSVLCILTMKGVWRWMSSAECYGEAIQGRCSYWWGCLSFWVA